ncbi:MAG TPA: hypothetical protein PLR25_15320, partial [Planctomycetaceae bacterium]|nr:hypothetical protein [Planctomycetaceae bacterium]
MFRLSVNSRATATVRAIGLLAAVLMMPAADAQKQAGGLLDGAALFGNTGPAVDVEISAVLKRIGEGQTEIQVTATVPQGYYIYSMNRSFSGATTIKLLDTGTLKANKLLSIWIGGGCHWESFFAPFTSAGITKFMVPPS